jgi:AmiR/NasT family two-component response regulator
MAETDGSELARLTAELADLTRRADAQERKVRELEIALESRIVIEQAVGMLAERFELSVADAFDLLRRAARDSRRQLRMLATEVTRGRATPPEVVAARGKA